MSEVWLDTSTGKLAIGEVAVEQLAQTAGSTAVPLEDLLAADEFPFRKGDFEIPPPRKLDYDTNIANGRLLLQALQNKDIHTLEATHVRRAHILGLLASERTIYRMYGGMNGLNKLCEAVVPPGNSSEFDAYSDETVIAMVLEAHTLAKGKHADDLPITVEEIEEHSRLLRTPSYNYILERLGGLGGINEQLGFPDIRSWGKLDYVEYGVRFLEENDPKLLTPHGVNILSEKHLGPHTTAIRRHFGTFKEFRELVQAEQAARQARVDAALRHIKPFARPHVFDNIAADRARSKAVAGQYEIVGRCVPDLSPQKHAHAALMPTTAMTHAIRSHKPHMSPADIELEAMYLGVYDDVWPVDRRVRSLQVNPADIAVRKRQATAATNRYKRRAMRRKRPAA